MRRKCWVSIGSFCFAFIQILLPTAVLGDRIKEKIYIKFDTYGFCPRRFNESHEIGCTSAESGNIGVLHYVQETADLDYVTVRGLRDPYIAIINVQDLDFYNVPTLRKLQDSGRVKGVILIRNSNATSKAQEPFSPDKTCPNDGYGLYGGSNESSCGDLGFKWNPMANEMFFQKWDIPIFMLVRDQDINTLLDNCTLKYNGIVSNESAPSWPLCAAELKSFMFGSSNSQTCIRRTDLVTNFVPQARCSAFSYDNIFATLNPMNKSAENDATKPKSTIVIAARLDSPSMLVDGQSENRIGSLAPGADSPMTGLVTLLLMAQTLAKVREDLKNKRILFVLFSGEGFDYIGSSRVVFDMENGRFPEPYYSNVYEQNAHIGLEDIEFFLELSQLGSLKNSSLYLHADPGSGKDPTLRRNVTSFASIAQEEAAKLKLEAIFLDFSQQLPPSSFQRFLKTGLNISGVVVAEHKQEFANPFYNSMFDTLTNPVFRTTPYQVATIMARSLYKMITNKSLDLEADRNMSETLVDCYGDNSNCSLFQTLLDTEQAEKYLRMMPVGFDVAVASNDIRVLATDISFRLLALFTGTPQYNVTSAANCMPFHNDSLNMFTFVRNNMSTNEGYCVKSGAGRVSALSPAFQPGSYDYSGKYSTWTESVWENDISFRIFLQPNPQIDINTLIVGIVSTLLFTVVIYGVSRSANDIFLVARE